MSHKQKAHIHCWMNSLSTLPVVEAKSFRCFSEYISRCVPLFRQITSTMNGLEESKLDHQHLRSVSAYDTVAGVAFGISRFLLMAQQTLDLGLSSVSGYISEGRKAGGGTTWTSINPHDPTWNETMTTEQRGIRSSKRKIKVAAIGYGRTGTVRGISANWAKRFVLISHSIGIYDTFHPLATFRGNRNNTVSHMFHH